MKKIFVLTTLTVFFTATLSGADFGFILNGLFETEGSSDTDTGAAVSGSIGLAPWFSLSSGELDIFFSAGLNTVFEDDAVLFVPQLNRLEIAFKPVPALTIRAGRIPWQDVSRFIARGLFDGADVLFDLGKVQVGASALYTGLLYKKTADINVSPADSRNYTKNFDWADFGNTYFAPPRLLTTLYGEFPGFPYQRGHLFAGLMAQFDLSEADERFHTQYLMLRHSFAYRSFDLTAAGAAGLENTDAEGIRASFAFALESGLRLSAIIRDRLSLGLRWSSGNGPDAAAFFPITREAQGIVLQPVFSGMMVIRAQYETRLLPSLTAALGGRYFIRTDSTGFTDPYLEDSSYFLGMETDGSVLWVPFSDLAFSVTGGVFFPKTGPAFAANAPVRYTLTMGTIFTF